MLAEAKVQCWMGALTYDVCCFPPPHGNPVCWDNFYTPALCCTPEGQAAATESPPPVSTIAPPPLELPEGVADDGSGSQGLFGGCEWLFFQTFKARALSWFKERRSSLALFHEFIAIMQQFNEVFVSCAPAALTAMLLKLESVYYEDELQWFGLLEIYLRKHHEALEEGSLERSHILNGWPLRLGMNRILNLRALGRDSADAAAALEVAKTPKVQAEVGQEASVKTVVDIVICYCAERLVWLRALHQLPWKDEDHSATIRANVGLRIYHKCGPMGRAARSSERQRIHDAWDSYFKVVEVRYIDDAVRADDCSAYLGYVVDRYDSLPPAVIFLHADAPEHIPSLELLTDVVYATAKGFLPPELGFSHLAHNYVLHDCAPKGQPMKTGKACEGFVLDGFEFPLLWKSVFGASVAPSLANGDLNAYCCVQFLARSERIRQRPKSFYERAFTFFGTSPESYHKLFPVGRVVRKQDAMGRTPCQLAMYIWHAMFGEPLRLPRRQQDVNMPLFMRLQNIEVEALEDEEERNDPMLEMMIESNIRTEQGPWSTAARVGSLFDVPETGPATADS